MGRLTIDLTAQQHKSLKAIAALEGKSIKQYSIEKLFAGMSDAQLADENEAWNELKALLTKRIDDAEANGYSSRTITDIFNEVLAQDEAA